MYKFNNEDMARAFAAEQQEDGWDIILTRDNEGYWWVEVL